ncbi:MAG: hypothetical protein K8L99_29765 [Anaerolineae bacterium]|nr:hypothetical protein [Anaerolineae bacterium]
MWRKTIFTLGLLAMAAIPALAQDHGVTFDDISFGYDAGLGNNVNIAEIPGDPVESAGPGFSDAAKTQFTFYNLGEPTDSLFDTGGVRIYRMDELAQYDFLWAQVEQLQTLLAERPDLAAYEPGINDPSVGTLPYVPVLPHSQDITARAQYIETEMLQGISYVTAFRAAQEPFNSQSFLYTFQGISSDGQYYLAVTFTLNTALFPENPVVDPVEFQEQWPQYLTESIETLNTAESSAFTPDLALADALVQSITFTQQ